jgi:hypothetical protein
LLSLPLSDVTLDFFSSEFDPLKALTTAGLKPPLPVPSLSTWNEAAFIAQQEQLPDELFADELGEEGTNQASDVNSKQSSVAVPSAKQPPSTMSTAATSIRVDFPSIASSNHGAPAIDFHQQSNAGSIHLPMNSPTPTAYTHDASRDTAADTAVPAASATSVSNVSIVGALGGKVSRMSAEQVRLNRERSDKKAAERAEVRDKSKHFIQRFTTQFPVPKPISTHTQKAKVRKNQMNTCCFIAHPQMSLIQQNYYSRFSLCIYVDY